MTWLLPRSLAARLVLLVVGGLLAAHLVGFGFIVAERLDAGRRAVRLEAAERVAALVGLLNEAPPELRERIVRLLDSPRLRVRLAPRTDLAATPGAGLEADLVERLSAVLDNLPEPPRVAMGREATPPADSDERRRPPRRGPPADLRVAIPLADGQWLDARVAIRPPTLRWSGPWLVPLLLSAAVVVVIVFLMARRMTRPLRALAEAANRAGRGEAIGQVESEGPSEIRAVIDAFNTMQERLSRFVAERTRMLAAISHDLRTPITSLRLRAEMIEADDLRDGIVDTLEDMEQMVAATLDFAREDAGGEDTRATDLAALVEGLVDDFAMAGGAVTFAGPERLVWRCRPRSLRRALRNLIENAVRYGGTADVRLEQAADAAIVRVADKGPGIPPADLERVFAPFARLETSRSRETGGAGLGLAIARDIVRAHGGEVSLGNREGGGLEATVSLP